MDSVPVRVNHLAPAGGKAPAGTTEGKSGQKKNKKKLVLIVVGAICVVILAVATAFFYRSYATGSVIDAGKYQAVFFTNGQVYFGKLHQADGGYLKLTDVFYIQAKSGDAADSKNPQQTGSQQSSDLQLIKLGSEVHGPMDEMVISKDQMLFFENLKTDGKVASTIAKYNKEKK